MKMKALLALGLCFALTVPSLAQDKEPKEVDSVYITPFAGAKIILVGKGMKKLLKENNFEVLKNKFIQDYQESAKDKDFPAVAKNIIYLAGADGRRRLKAIPDEVAPVDVKEEIKAFNNNLPPFHYTIYDLMKNYRYHMYVPSPDALNELASVNCSNTTLANANGTINLKRQTAISFTATDTGFVMSKQLSKKTKVISLAGAVNGLYVNNNFSPGIELDIAFVWSSKYGKPLYKLNAISGINFFSEIKDGNTLNVYNINNSSIQFLVNFGSQQKERWFGLSYGRFSTFAEADSSKNSNLYKARKVGLVSQFNNWGLEYNFIFGRNDKVTAGLTLRYYF